MVTGIICEYNPLHLGHKKQLDTVKATGNDVVCLMSGNFVQRGKPAIVDKQARAEAALVSGADLVLELPVTAALSSAEGFAAEGVRILSGFCDQLSFGAEHADPKLLCDTATALLSPQFQEHLRQELEKGLSFPAARQAALTAMGVPADLLALPNNILGVEYCKAIISQNVQLKPCPITRQGNYHDTHADPENPSATAVRSLMLQSGAWLDYIPEVARPVFSRAPIHELAAGERAILGKLRTMTDAEFQQLPYGSEGLWRKLMHNSRQYSNLEQILTETKSKRYTRTRLDRMVMCAFLGLTQADLNTPAPYVRVLGFNDRGREILKNARQSGEFLNIGQAADHPYQQTENRINDLYGLFRVDSPAPAGQESQRRVYYHK